MASVKYNCDQCGSKFSIKYDEYECEDSPHFCSFCGEMMVDVDEDLNDEDE